MTAARPACSEMTILVLLPTRPGLQCSFALDAQQSRVVPFIAVLEEVHSVLVVCRGIGWVGHTSDLHNNGS